MAQYYQFSLLTIAGTMLNMENGLLNPHLDDITPWASKLVRLPYRDKTNTQTSFFYVYTRKVHLMDEYWASVRSSHLFCRGWILQEWLRANDFSSTRQPACFSNVIPTFPEQIAKKGLRLKLRNQMLGPPCN
jgi:hypothetical protein